MRGRCVALESSFSSAYPSGGQKETAQTYSSQVHTRSDALVEIKRKSPLSRSLLRCSALSCARHGKKKKKFSFEFRSLAVSAAAAAAAGAEETRVAFSRPFSIRNIPNGPKSRYYFLFAPFTTTITIFFLLSSRVLFDPFGYQRADLWTIKVQFVFRNFTKRHYLERRLLFCYGSNRLVKTDNWLFNTKDPWSCFLSFFHLFPVRNQNWLDCFTWAQTSHLFITEPLFFDTCQ